MFRISFMDCFSNIAVAGSVIRLQRKQLSRRLPFLNARTAASWSTSSQDAEDTTKALHSTTMAATMLKTLIRRKYSVYTTTTHISMADVKDAILDVYAMDIDSLVSKTLEMTAKGRIVYECSRV